MFAYALCLCAFVAWSATLAGADDASVTSNYGVLIDAGSSSSKLKVYSWSPGSSDLEVPQVDLIYTEKFSPGFSSFGDDLSQVKPYLENIIAAAKTKVPAELYAQTPISVLATAGLRLLNLEQADGLVDEIRAVLSDSSVNPFSYSAGRVQILSGEEEAVYAWISLNYLLGFFQGSQPDNKSTGVMEMGGGSTQIAFIPSDPLLSEEFHVTLAKRQYSLYAQSYLDYGLDAVRVKEAYELTQIARVPKRRRRVTLNDPCWLTGDSRTVQLTDGPEVTLRGTSNPRNCKLLLRKKLVDSNEGYDCSPKPCAIGSVYQPLVHDMPFYATSAFQYAAIALGVIDKDHVHLDIGLLESEAEAYCTQTYQEVLDQGVEAQYVSSNCLNGLYFPALLDTYGFDRENTDQISVTGKVNGENIDWALGAMIEILSTSFSGQPDAYAVRRRRRSA